MPDIEWLEAHREALLRYATHLLRDASEAEDVLQEVWLRVVRYQTTLRDEGAQVTWLYRITTHLCLDHLRRHKRRFQIDSTIEPDDVLPDEMDAPTLVATLERREMSECIQGFVERLPDHYRSVLFLSEFEDLTDESVAETLGITLGTAKIRLFRARQQLKEALKSGCCLARDERGVLVCTPR